MRINQQKGLHLAQRTQKRKTIFSRETDWLPHRIEIVKSIKLVFPDKENESQIKQTDKIPVGSNPPPINLSNVGDFHIGKI